MLVAGTISGFTVDGLGNATFNGAPAGSVALAYAVGRATARLAACGFPPTDPLPAVGQTSAPYSPAAPCTADIRSRVLQQLNAIYGSVVGDANVDAAVLVAQLTTNAVVTVPAAGISDSTHNPCIGSATGTVA
jgi:hypothetical protein